LEEKIINFTRELKILMIKYEMNFPEVAQALAIIHAEENAKRREALLKK